MAAETDDLELKPADAGALFRAEMATTNFVLGYWKAMVAVVVVVLASVLFYGQYTTWAEGKQRAAAGRIALVEARIKVPIINLSEGLAAEQITSDELAKAAAELVVIAQETTGPSRVEADLKAAEIFRVLNRNDERRAALDDALPHAEGVLAYAAAGALANLDLEQGQGDAAVERWRALIAKQKGFLAEQATLELGLTLESLGRVDEARQLYADFAVTYPTSSRAETARQRADRLGNPG